MPMQYPPLSDGTYRYGDPPRPRPSPVPGPDPTGPLPGGPAPSPGSPVDGPPPADGPGRARPRGAVTAAAIVGGLGLVVVLVLGLVLTGPGPGDGVTAADRLRVPAPSQVDPRFDPPPVASTFTVDGSFTVVASPGEPVSGDGVGCELPGSLSDIGEGTEITLTEGAASTIGTTKLVYDQGDLSSCTFVFGFDEVPAGASYYLVEIPGRGQLTYTENELRAGVDITLGR